MDGATAAGLAETEPVAAMQEEPGIDPVLDMAMPAAIPDDPTSFNPLLEVFGEAAWEKEERERDESRAREYTEGLRRIHAFVLDPDSRGDLDFRFAADPEKARKRAANDAYLELQNGGDPVPVDETARGILMARTARRRFSGRGAANDEAFFTELSAAAGKARETEDLFRNLQDHSARQEFVRRDGLTIGKSNLRGFAAWKRAASAMPGYDRGLESDYFQTWLETQRQVTERVNHFRPQLDAVFTAFERQEGYTAAAEQAYDQLPEEQRKPFLAALMVRARTLSREDQEGFFINFFKRSGRDVGGLIKGVKVTATGEVLQGGTVGWEDFFGTNEQLAAKNLRDAEARARFRKRANFAAEVTEMQQEVYDPIRYLTDDTFDPESPWTTGWSRRWEKTAYGTPGVFASSAAAVYAAPVLFLGLHEGHYQSIRHTILEEGGSEEEADRIGSQLAPFGAGLELFSERLGGKLLAGRLPAFEKALGRAMDGISSAPLRFAARAGTGWAQEGVQEVAQGYVDEVVLDLGHALGMDVKDRQWLGPGGVFDGDFAANLDTFVQAGPLAVAGAAKGLAREARIRAFIEASDDTLLAIGIPPKDVDEIRKAKGPEEQEAAINRGSEQADPQSETARDASHRLKQQAKHVRIDAEDLKAEGVVPPVTRLRDGTWVARDLDTGEELVRTKSLSGSFLLMEVMSGDSSSPAPLGNSTEAGSPQAPNTSPVPEFTNEEIQRVTDQAFANARKSRIVNTDDVRPLIRGYQEADPMVRDSQFHKTASGINDAVLERMLADPPGESKEVIILAGGGGSGKSAAVSVISAKPDLFVDTTLSHRPSAISLIERVKKSGRNVQILYVHRKFEKAFDSIIGRYLQSKAAGQPRLVPLDVAIKAHMGAQETILSLGIDEIMVFDNNGSLEDLHEISLDQLRQQQYRNNHEADAGTEGTQGGNHLVGHRGLSKTDPHRRGEDREGPGGTGPEARLKAAGERVLAEYESRGRLTPEEVAAFLGAADGIAPNAPAAGKSGSDSGAGASDFPARDGREPGNPADPSDGGDGELSGDSIGERFSQMNFDPRSATDKQKQRFCQKMKRVLKQRASTRLKVVKDREGNLSLETVKQKGKSSAAELFADELTFTYEENHISVAPWEITCVYSQEGRLFDVMGGTSADDTPFPTNRPPNATVTHNHTRGLGPSDTDLARVLQNPDVTLRIVISKNELSRREIFSIKAKGHFTKAQIKELVDFYRINAVVDGDTHQSRRESVRLTLDKFPDMITITSRILP